MNLHDAEGGADVWYIWYNQTQKHEIGETSQSSLTSSSSKVGHSQGLDHNLVEPCNTVGTAFTLFLQMTPFMASLTPEALPKRDNSTSSSTT